MSSVLKHFMIFLFLFLKFSGVQAAADRIFGTYVTTGKVKASLVVEKREGDTVRIFLEGGSNSMDGPSVAADCEAAAEGKLNANVLRAKLVPFEGELYSLSASDIARLDSTVVVTFRQGSAIVQGTFPHCGLRSSLAGAYRKVGTRRPSINK